MLLLIGAGALVSAWGCASRETRFQVTNFDLQQGTQRFFERFDECYYSVDPSGNIDVIARRHSESDDAGVGDITQVVHLRTVYRSAPGSMASDRTMINTTVTYAILGPDGGSCYEGAGFMYVRENTRTGALRGQLELSTVAPHRQVGDPAIIFEHAELTGQFVARKDRRRVVRMCNELRRVFGDMPRYQPARVPADVM